MRFHFMRLMQFRRDQKRTSPCPVCLPGRRVPMRSGSHLCRRSSHRLRGSDLPRLAGTSIIVALGKSIAECWSANMDAERNSMGLHPTEIAINQLRYLFESQFRSPFGQSIGTKRHILDYRIIMRGALTAASNAAFDLVFIHFPIPHPPLFYDRTTGRYDLGDRPLVSLLQRNTLRYLDGLELVHHQPPTLRPHSRLRRSLGSHTPDQHL